METLLEATLKSSGRLRKRFLPALYLDPSFFAHYVAAAVAVDQPAAPAAAERETLAPAEVAAYAEVTRRVRAGALGITPVLSALTLLRWMQETASRFRAEDPAARQASSREEVDFAGLRYQSWLNRLLGDGLAGLMQVPLQGFGLTVEAAWDDVPAPALLDGPERSTLHALAARHLGCTHLATTSSDMARICELLRAGGGPQPLLGPQAVLDALPPAR